MKKKVKLYLKLGVYLFGVVLLLQSCEKEEFFENEIKSENAKLASFSKRTLSLSSLPKVKEMVDDLSYKKRFGKTESTVIFNENVLEVIDSLNFTNYTVGFKFSDTEPGTFYNLVLGKTAMGQLKDPWVFKYVCDDASLADYLANNEDFNYFKGKVSLHRYTDFFELGYFSKSTTCSDPDLDADGNPIACEEEEITGGNGGDPDVPDTDEDPDAIGDDGGHGDNNLMDPGGGGDSIIIQNCSRVAYVVNCGGSSSLTQHTFASCGGENKYTTAIVWYVWECEQQNYNRTAVTDCPDCDENLEGVIGLENPNATEDCKELNGLLGKSNISNALSTIQGLTGDNNEHGFVITKDPDTGIYSSSPKIIGWEDGIKLPQNKNVVGGIHCHNKNGYGMFSGEDILQLYYYFIANQNSDEAFTMLSTPYGTFALTPKDKNILGAILNSIGVDDLNALLNKKYKKAGNDKEKLKQALLLVFRDIQQEKGYPINALNLFEYNSNTNKFERVTLNTDNTVDNLPCK